VAVLEVAEQPARRDARMPARILARDQDRQLKGVDEVERRELLCRRLRDQQVSMLKRPLEDRIGTALRGRRSSSLGPDGRPSLGIRRRTDQVRAVANGPGDLLMFVRLHGRLATSTTSAVGDAIRYGENP
jgi:hypothetical protein